jgi:hypothetical protein
MTYIQFLCTLKEHLKKTIQDPRNVIKPGFHMVVTVVKIESRSFSSAEPKNNILELKIRGVIITREYTYDLYKCGLQV